MVACLNRCCRRHLNRQDGLVAIARRYSSCKGVAGCPSWLASEPVRMRIPEAGPSLARKVASAAALLAKHAKLLRQASFSCKSNRTR
mmetsp:Transcript_39242/g.116750  ORF Transcript_39242/g.116750 Transcript_39242/m.116750 type:complete len:87 (-) Transcript_39242:6-266(-)